LRLGDNEVVVRYFSAIKSDKRLAYQNIDWKGLDDVGIS
jgi:hypothetical protein